MLPLRRFRRKAGWREVQATLSFRRPQPPLRRRAFGRTGWLLNTRWHWAFHREVVMVGHA
jgi:hypothetical protein